MISYESSGFPLSLGKFKCIYVHIYVCTETVKLKKMVYKFINSQERILKPFILRQFYWHSFSLIVFIYSAYFVNA